MNILLLLIPLSVMLLGVAIWAFAWAVRRGQFDDLDTPALDILADDERPADAPPHAAHLASADSSAGGDDHAA